MIGWALFFLTAVYILDRRKKIKKPLVNLHYGHEGNKILAGRIVWECGCVFDSSGGKLCPAHDLLSNPK